MTIRSSLGGQLARSEILSTDSKGKRIPALPAGWEGVRCRETPPHALSSPTADDSRDEQMERAGRAANEIAKLTDMEREVLRLQGKLKQRVEERITIAAGELKRWLDDGYTLIPGSEQEFATEGRPTLSCVEVVGYRVIEVDKLDQASIAERMGLPMWKVKKLVSSANARLRKAERR